MQTLAELDVPGNLRRPIIDLVNHLPPGALADALVALVDAPATDKLTVLRTIALPERLICAIKIVQRQAHMLRLTHQLGARSLSELGKKQRELQLRQQLKTIQDELGESGTSADSDIADPEHELDELGRRIEAARLPDEVLQMARRELRRLKRMHPAQAESSVLRTYLEWLLDLPWSTTSPDLLDIPSARAQLDADHHGLTVPKRRVLEFLAVRKLAQGDVRGPILCLVGPPGVGKTSLAASIARALNRKFMRVSLGGVRDEAEIRGHRRTYVGALPGLLIQGLRKAGVNNPVCLLDEIDKLGRDMRGDPAAALLEVLDPEQNRTFFDHYLNVPFDLSRILFVATANDPDTIPPALLDRMEVIRLPGYTYEEKHAIARGHLWPKQLRIHGLEPKTVTLTDDDALARLADGYTREAGVRGLERELAAICRAIAIRIAESSFTDSTTMPATESSSFIIDAAALEPILGVGGPFMMRVLIC